MILFTKLCLINNFGCSFEFSNDLTDNRSWHSGSSEDIYGQLILLSDLITFDNIDL